MKINKLSLIPLILATMTLAGCASDSKRVVDLNLKYITSSSAPVKTTNKHAQSQLAQATTSVSHSLQQLSAIEIATHPRAKLPHPKNAAAIGMAQQASLDWTGPVEPLLKRIAAATHYKLRVLGSKPAIPVVVSITARNKTLAEILRNATFQVERKAKIVVYSKKKVIELRYYHN